MRIRTKINGSVFIIIFAFVAAIIMLIFTGVVSNELQNLESQATFLLADMYKLNSLTKDILVSESSIHPVWGKWNDHRKATQDRLNTILDHPARTYLTEETNQKLDNNVKLWDHMNEEFDKTNKDLNEVIDNEEIPNEQLIGIVRMLLDPRKEQYLDPVARYHAAKASRSFSVLIETASDFMDSNISKIVNKISNQSQKLSSISKAASAGFAGIIALGSAVFALLFSKNLSIKIQEIESVMREAAAKDLTVRADLKSSDELGSLSSNLNKVMGSLSAFMSTVKNTTSQIGLMEETLSAGTAESASAVNQISKNIESITERINSLNDTIQLATQRVGDIGGRINSLAESVDDQTDVISRSSASIEEMNASIQNISKLTDERRAGVDNLLNVTVQGGEKVSSTNDMIKSVSHEISDIIEIIEIINSISEQTNLLSMNAAIESAHAGEVGKGFAVVAEEIRKLAESTSENSKNIEASLKSITSKIKEALHMSDESYSSFEDIQNEVTRFADSLKEISASMEEISEGSNELLQTTGAISQNTKDVQEGSREIKNWIGEINTAMVSTTNLSNEVTQGMDEIKTGTKEILSSVTEINKMSDDSRTRMDDLDSLLKTYQTNGDNGEGSET
jgi:methyl-accepting chemotaxis protein